MAVIDKINELRKEKGITEKQMAKDLDVSHRTLQGYFLHEISPKLSFLEKCAKYFNVPIIHFFGGSFTNTAHVKGRHIEGAKFNYPEFNGPAGSYGGEVSLKNEINILWEVINSKNELIEVLKKQLDAL